MNEEQLKEKFAAKDLNSDGKLSWEEFVEAMIFHAAKKKTSPLTIV